MGSAQGVIRAAAYAGACACLATPAASIAGDLCWLQPGDAAEVYHITIEAPWIDTYCLVDANTLGATCWDVEACNGDLCSLSSNGPRCSDPADVNGDGGIGLDDLVIVLDALLTP